MNEIELMQWRYLFCKLLINRILTKNLNSIVLTCLGGPLGDPDHAHIEAANIAIATLELFNLPVNHRPTGPDDI